jgi:hypothetical protein
MENDVIRKKPFLLYSSTIIAIGAIGYICFPEQLLVAVLSQIFIFIWICFCHFKPIYAFGFLVVIFGLVYSRASIPFIDLAGGHNRGNLLLSDFLWLILFCVFSLKFIFRARIKIPTKNSKLIILCLPFVILSLILPIIGVLFGDWPISYITPGLRHLQWASFALISYCLAYHYGIERTSRVVLISYCVWACGFHFLYALVQFACTKNWLSNDWLFFDQLFAAHNEKSWIHYPRLTGFFINPNSYGVFCSFALMFPFSLSFLNKSKEYCVVCVFSLCCGVLGLFLSGSRSPLIGLGCAFLFLVIFIGIPFRRLNHSIKIILKAIMAAACMIAILWPFLENEIQDRYIRFTMLPSQGAAADANFIVRAQGWRDVTSASSQYPFGTLVPPSYALSAPIDNYYLHTVMQGTIGYTIAWIVMLVVFILIGQRSFQKSETTMTKSVSMLLILFVGIMFGCSLSLSPMLQPPLSIMLYTLFGLSFYTINSHTVETKDEIA